MRGTIAIAWKDFKTLASTPLFFIVAGLCSLVWSFMYWRVLDLFSAMSLQYSFRNRGQGEEGLSLHFEMFVKHISLVNFLMIIAVPALTMRLIAEEKKLRTYDLLLTSPVTATQIALGKYFAGLLSVSALLLISFLYPLSTAFVAEIQWGPLLSSYLGLFMISATYVAVGLFASSMTSSVVLAVIMALIFNVGLWFVGSGAEMAQGDLSKAIFNHLSVGEHFLGFIKGSVELTALVFFSSIIFLCCFLTQRVIESSRWR